MGTGNKVPGRKCIHRVKYKMYHGYLFIRVNTGTLELTKDNNPTKSFFSTRRITGSFEFDNNFLKRDSTKEN